MTILRLILHSKELEGGKDVPFDDFFNQMPFMESEFADGTMGADQFRSLEPPRYMKNSPPFPTLEETAGKTSRFEGHTNSTQSKGYLGVLLSSYDQ